MALALMVILLLTALGWWLSRSTPLGQQLGMTLVVLVLGLLVTNITGLEARSAGGWLDQWTTHVFGDCPVAACD